MWVLHVVLLCASSEQVAIFDWAWDLGANVPWYICSADFRTNSKWRTMWCGIQSFDFSTFFCRIFGMFHNYNSTRIHKSGRDFFSNDVNFWNGNFLCQSSKILIRKNRSDPIWMLFSALYHVYHGHPCMVNSCCHEAWRYFTNTIWTLKSFL